MIKAVRKKHGYHNIELSELVTEYREYWFACLDLANGKHKKAMKLYKKSCVIKLNEMITDKLAREFQEPDISIQDEYKKISG